MVDGRGECNGGPFVLSRGGEPSHPREGATRRISQTVPMAPRSNRRDRGIEAPEDLRGKKVGVTKGTNAEFFLDPFLVYRRLPREEITLVDLKPEELLPALREGSIDAASTWNPHAIRLQRELGENGVTFTEDQIYTWFWNLGARKTFLADRAQTMGRVLQALFSVTEFV